MRRSPSSIRLKFCLWQRFTPPNPVVIMVFIARHKAIFRGKKRSLPTTLLNAAPQVLWALDGTKFVIIGGGNTDHLRAQAWNLGIWERGKPVND